MLPYKADLQSSMSLQLYKPMFAFFFFFLVCFGLDFLFVFVFEQERLSFFSPQHCCMEWDKLWYFFSSGLLLFLGEKYQGACLLFLPSRYSRHKALHRSCTNPCRPWQKNGRRWERPGILPGSADFRNEDCTRLSPEPKGWEGRVPVCYTAAMISCSLLLSSCLPSSNACSL